GISMAAWRREVASSATGRGAGSAGRHHRPHGARRLRRQAAPRSRETARAAPGGPWNWSNFRTGRAAAPVPLPSGGPGGALNTQSYSVDASELGRPYLSRGWDQAPHLISTSAKTIVGGVGTSSLTVPNSVQAALQAQLPNAALAAPPAANGVLGQTARTNIENIINSNLAPLELWTRRDTATGGYRFTPTPEWDFGVDYSHEHRTGLRPTGVSWGYTCTGPATATTPGCTSPATPQSPRPTNVVEIPQPLNDTTQNVEGK